MRTALVFGVTFLAGAIFFACAKGDEAGTAGGGGDDTTGTEDGGGDGSHDANTSYVKDSSTTSDDGATDGGVDAAPVCVESDAGCLTGSPGACSDGILHCDGGVPFCEAITTTESCYSGSVSTRNIGICHDGTQTCTGSLGACTGEVDPAAHEDCFNDLDDDCNGLVNDGCPSSLKLGTQRSLSSAGSGTGGGSHTVVCPAGAFVTRVDSWFDSNSSNQFASGVSIYCATPSLVQGASSYTVTLAANTPAPYLTEHGTDDPAIQRTDDCGISGLTAMHRSITQADSHVEGEGYHCATSTVTFSSTDNSIMFDFSNIGDSSYNTFPGGTVVDQSCSFLEVLVGFTVRDGAYLDNITPICAPLQTVYSAGTPDP
jgi:hypothetical protein